MYRKKVTGKLLTTDLLIIVLKFFVLNFKGIAIWDHVFSVRPFRRHLFRCRTSSAQIVSAPIRCCWTVHLFKVWVRALGWCWLKSTEYWRRKRPRRNGRAEKS